MNALTIQSLSKVYSNGVKALDQVSFHVAQGDFFALLGPNGAGKTTLIGLVTSLLKRTGGEIYIFGKDLTKQWIEARSYIGVVPQEFNFSIFDGVKHIVERQAGYYGINRKTTKQRLEKYLKLLNLWDKRDCQAMQLSGGMKRRLMIARALISEPKLLILDEPTAGVDIELRHAMWDVLRKLNQEGITIILTTHYLEEAENLCRHLAIINHGKLITHTDIRELLRRLKVQTFVLDIEQPLGALPTLGNFNCRLVDNNVLEVEVTKDDSINHLFELLSKKNIKVLSLRNKTNRLEELFVQLISA